MEQSVRRDHRAVATWSRSVRPLHLTAPSHLPLQPTREKPNLTFSALSPSHFQTFPIVLGPWEPFENGIQNVVQLCVAPTTASRADLTAVLLQRKR